MRNTLYVIGVLVLGMAMSVTLTSCGDDEEPTMQQQQEQGNGDDNENNGNNGDVNNGGGQSGEDKSGEIGGRKHVDLGLPSGTLWATCNVGADTPEEYGGYFAWGETVPYGGEDFTNAMNYAYPGNAGGYTKTYYDWSTYKYCNGLSSTLTNLCPPCQTLPAVV